MIDRARLDREQKRICILKGLVIQAENVVTKANAFAKERMIEAGDLEDFTCAIENATSDAKGDIAEIEERLRLMTLEYNRRPAAVAEE